MYDMYPKDAVKTCASDAVGELSGSMFRFANLSSQDVEENRSKPIDSILYILFINIIQLKC